MADDRLLEDVSQEGDFHEFEVFLEESNRALDEVVRDVVAKFSLKVVGGVDRRMRVDTGRLRAGTLLSPGGETGRETDRLDKTPRGQQSFVTMTLAAIASDSIKPYEDVAIENHVEYAGWREAKDFMFAQAIEEALAEFA